MFPNLKTSPLYWSLFNYTCPTEAWFRPSFFSGSNMHVGLSYCCRGKPIFKLWVESKSISSTSPRLLLGERAGTVDSVSSNFTANYCTVRVLAQPDRFICSLTYRLCLPFLLASLLRIYPCHPRNIGPQGLLPHSLREHKLHQKQKQQRRQCGFKCPPQKTWKRAGLALKISKRSVPLDHPIRKNQWGWRGTQKGLSILFAFDVPSCYLSFTTCS